MISFKGCIIHIAMIVLLIGQHSIIWSQAKSGFSRAAQKAFEQGQGEIAQGQLSEAEHYLLKAIELEAGWREPRVTLAALYFEQANWNQSRFYFESALVIDSLADPVIHFKLGEIAWRTQDYEKVISSMERTLLNTRIKPSIRHRAEKYIRDARFLSSNPPSYQTTIKPLPPTINTENMEYLPSFPAREDWMIFTRRVRGQEDFYISKLIDGHWQESMALTELNTDQNEGAHCLSADGKMLIYTACDRPDGYGSCDLYYSLFDGVRWSKPANLGSTVNSRYWDGQPSLSANGRTLYFSSERPGGAGGRDLWMINRKGGGWDEPKNISELNTPANEEVPFIHFADDNLYFMSDGHPGFGGTDLFQANYIDGIWQNPQNLGEPINTSGDEGALHITLSGAKGYFARGVYGTDKRDRIDIFEFDIPDEIRPRPATYANIRILDKKTRQPLQAILEIINLANGEIHTKTLSDKKGELLVCLPLDEEYALNISKEQYAFHSEHIQLDQRTSIGDPMHLTVFLSMIETNEPNPTADPIVLNNVFFESGSANLLAKSGYELKRLLQLLQDNQGMMIEIRGHTDNVGSDSDNQQLSEKRAQAVYNYLIAAGVSNERLSYKGFGESTPIADNLTEEGRQRNRRTEFVILSNEKK